MTDETSTAEILQEMKVQMDALPEQMVAMQRLQPGIIDAHNSDEEAEEISGTGSRLVMLSDMTQIFLEAAFSGTMTNEDHREESIRLQYQVVTSPKLDGVMKVVSSKDTIKADGYLQQFG